MEEWRRESNGAEPCRDRDRDRERKREAKALVALFSAPYQPQWKLVEWGRMILH